MKPQKKPTIDWEKGIRRRVYIDNHLNSYFKSKGSDVRVRPLNPMLKKMCVHEKVKNCCLDNFIETKPLTAMGLYREVSLLGKSKVIHLIYLFKKGGFFLKVPKEYKENPEAYLDTLQELDFYVLPIDDVELTFGSPMSILEVKKYWGYKMATSKGNTNRLQFHGKIGTISCLPLGEADFFTKPLEQMFEILLERFGV